MVIQGINSNFCRVEIIQSIGSNFFAGKDIGFSWFNFEMEIQHHAIFWVVIQTLLLRFFLLMGALILYIYINMYIDIYIQDTILPIVDIGTTTNISLFFYTKG